MMDLPSAQSRRNSSSSNGRRFAIRCCVANFHSDENANPEREHDHYAAEPKKHSVNHADASLEKKIRLRCRRDDVAGRASVPLDLLHDRDLQRRRPAARPLHFQKYRSPAANQQQIWYSRALKISACDLQYPVAFRLRQSRDCCDYRTFPNVLTTGGRHVFVCRLDLRMSRSGSLHVARTSRHRCSISYCVGSGPGTGAPLVSRLLSGSVSFRAARTTSHSITRSFVAICTMESSCCHSSRSRVSLTSTCLRLTFIVSLIPFLRQESYKQPPTTRAVPGLFRFAADSRPRVGFEPGLRQRIQSAALR